jgi:hypothetical protein
VSYPAAKQRAYRRAHAAHYRKLCNVFRRITIRLEMIRAYGSRCECCGERHFAFLALDHRHNDGAAHRRKCGGNFATYLDLRKRGWPKDGYRLLCHNCNQAIARYGVCPHSLHKQKKEVF